MEEQRQFAFLVSRVYPAIEWAIVKTCMSWVYILYTYRSNLPSVSVTFAGLFAMVWWMSTTYILGISLHSWPELIRLKVQTFPLFTKLLFPSRATNYMYVLVEQWCSSHYSCSQNRCHISPFSIHWNDTFFLMCAVYIVHRQYSIHYLWIVQPCLSPGDFLSTSEIVFN